MSYCQYVKQLELHKCYLRIASYVEGLAIAEIETPILS